MCNAKLTVPEYNICKYMRRCLITEHDRNFFVGFGKRIGIIVLREDDEGSIKGSS